MRGFQRPPARHADAAPPLAGTASRNRRRRDAVNGGRATDVRRIFHVRSDRWPKWACRRAPTKGGTARTLAGSVRYDAINYTAIGEFAYLSRKRSPTRILNAHHRFPEPCGPVGLQPSPKHVLGGPVKDVAVNPPPSSVHLAPATCPTRQSSAIVTKAKSRDADAHWQCTKGGEIWNASRTVTGRHGAYRWR